MQLHRLQYFLAVAETGSVSGAARKLHLSAASVSRAVSTLEQEVGAQLLVPLGRGVALTVRGRELARRSAPLVNELLALPDSIREHERSTLRLRVAAHGAFSSWFVPLIATAVPNSVVAMRHALPGDIEQLVARGEADIGLTLFAIPAAGVEHIRCFATRLSVWGLTGQWHRRSLDTLPFAVPIRAVEGSITRSFGIDGWPDDAVERKVAFEVTHTDTALALCRQALAVAYAPEFVVALHNEQVRTELALSEVGSARRVARTRPVYVVVRIGDERQQLIEALAAKAAGSQLNRA